MANSLVKRGKKVFLPFNIRNKEGIYTCMLVFMRWCVVYTHKSVYILYQMKAEIIYFISRSYKNMSFYEKLTS